jgi:ppGpp synthetase/RelA/SpoT-type nucleotidyltranferase
MALHKRSVHALAGDNDRILPPAQGIPLGLRLGLTTSLIVTLVLGTLMILHQGREIKREWEAREDLLKESLPSLASDIERASTTDEIRQRLSLFQQSYVRRGYPDHQIVLLGGDGNIVASSLKNREADPPPKKLSASLPVTSSLLPGGRGMLTVWQDGSEFYADVSQRWRFLWVALGLTILCILISLQTANYFLVAKPFGKLLEGVRKMERGYWGTLEVPRGAWEMRWLAWRFRNLGTDLEGTVRRLVEAERRVLESSHLPGGANGRQVSRVDREDVLSERKDVSLRHEMEQHYLWDKCRLLESLNVRDPATLPIAREAWDRDSLSADRLGEKLLKARLEDAALRVLHPDVFEDLSRRMNEEVNTSRQKWIREREEEITRTLEEQGIPCVSVQHRVKHVGGIWKKMQAKGLSFQEVYDLFAFRIIVPREEDCYLALDAIHRMFTPQMLRFKDYIARPKPNGYRSIHTSVVDKPGRMFEVQIRSVDMHHEAEPDHWNYKSSATRGEDETQRRRSFLGKIRMALSFGPAKPGK